MREGGQNERYISGQKPGRCQTDRQREAVKVRYTEVIKVISSEANAR